VATGGSYASGLRPRRSRRSAAPTTSAYIEQVVTKDSAPYTVTYNAYSDVINDVLHVVGNAASGASDVSLTQDQQALTAISQAIEAESEAAVITGQVIRDNGPLQAVDRAEHAGPDAAGRPRRVPGRARPVQAVATPSLVQSFNSTVSGPEVAGAAAGNAAALTVLQAPDPTVAIEANQLNLTTAVTDDDLATTLGDLRTVQAATIAQMQNDAQSLLTAPTTTCT
jgi:hypothetical protein